MLLHLHFDPKKRLNPIAACRRSGPFKANYIASAKLCIFGLPTNNDVFPLIWSCWLLPDDTDFLSLG